MDRPAAELIEARPHQAAHCIIERQEGRRTDAPVYILKDAAGSRYMMLSEEGLFLWRLIDGERTIKDLCGCYAAHYRARGPREVIQAIGRFYASGLIAFESLPLNTDERPARAQASRGWCTRYYWVSDIDRAVETLYRWLRPLFGAVAQAALLLIAAAGMIAFGRHIADGAWPAVSMSSGLLSLLLQVVIHEAAHAATCRRFGRRVHRAGIGWYYFAPVAFVDTSDIWAASRLQRVLVSAAGPYANLVASGIAGLCALMLPAGNISAALWSLSAVGYGLALVNMNPLLELDGYYIAMDLLELPNLRARAFARLGAVLRRSPRANDEPWLRAVLLAFGLASLAYGLAMAAGILVVSRATIASLAGAALPPLWVQAISLMLTGTMSLLVLKRLVDDLIAGTRRPQN